MPCSPSIYTAYRSKTALRDEGGGGGGHLIFLGKGRKSKVLRCLKNEV